MIRLLRRDSHMQSGSNFNARLAAAVLLSAAVALTVLLGGCAKAIPVHYYQITYPPLTVSNSPAYDVTLLVRPLFTSHLYREDRIIYGSNAEQMGVYLEERWAEPPTDMMQNAMIRGLRSTNRFRGVNALRSSTTGEYLIAGHLYEFKELDQNGTASARLSFDVQLRDMRTDQIVWTWSYNHDEPTTGPGVPGVAAAMDKNVNASMQALSAAIDEFFRTNPPKPGPPTNQ
jgi:cholesterol transport system auxiliary component